MECTLVLLNVNATVTLDEGSWPLPVGIRQLRSDIRIICDVYKVKSEVLDEWHGKVVQRRLYESVTRLRIASSDLA
jgi:hypothetical protein